MTNASQTIIGNILKIPDSFLTGVIIGTVVVGIVVIVALVYLIYKIREDKKSDLL